jgi:hypothetical protein
MKNIHLITTSQPSRLLCNHTLKSFCFQKEENGMFVNDGKVSGASFWSIEKAKNNGFNPQHTYITNDEEIKEGDWFYNTISLTPEPFKACENGDGYVNCSKYSHYRIDCKKIILTTDQDLIKDGVQAIDDEFLEWFVKNPSCEEVDVDKNWNYPLDKRWEYKIIIPQDEAKQRAKNYMSLKGALEPKQIKCYCGHTSYCDCSPLEEPKQEENEIIDISDHDGIGNAVDNLNNEPPQETTIEEAAKEFVLSHDFSQLTNPNHLANRCFQYGAKWMQERSYSEEDMKQFGLYLGDNLKKLKNKSIDEIFEQFKKK